MSVFSPQSPIKSTRGRHLVALKLLGLARMFFFAEVKLFINKRFFFFFQQRSNFCMLGGLLHIWEVFFHIGVKEYSIGLWWAWVLAGIAQSVTLGIFEPQDCIGLFKTNSQFGQKKTDVQEFSLVSQMIIRCGRLSRAWGTDTLRC